MAAEDLSTHPILADAITVVIAVRNGLPYVVEAVRSALAQGAAVDRVVVVDDGSDDETRAAVSQLADPRVHIIENPGRGVSRARNAGAACAHTRWLLFLDADDRLADGAAIRLLSAAKCDPRAVAIYGRHRRINANGQPMGHPLVAGLRRMVLDRGGRPSGDILGTLVRGNFIINGGVVIVAREAFTRLGGFAPDLSLCEDWHLWCRLAALGPIHYVPAWVMDYRVHGGSVMMRSQRRFEDFLPALDAIRDDAGIRARLSPADLARARLQAVANLKSYCAVQTYRNGARRAGLAMAWDAARRHPSKTPSLILRVGAAMAGL
jgi:glycosyltransferase involved in cell wall biosynthesis